MIRERIHRAQILDASVELTDSEVPDCEQLLQGDYIDLVKFTFESLNAWRVEYLSSLDKLS